MNHPEHEKVYKETRQEDVNRTANEGDVVDESKSLEEKKEQVAVESWDIAGHVETPTYFPVKDENGEEKALHHVRDLTFHGISGREKGCVISSANPCPKVKDAS